jgi:hypothetical protein
MPLGSLSFAQFGTSFGTPDLRVQASKVAQPTALTGRFPTQP